MEIATSNSYSIILLAAYDFNPLQMMVIDDFDTVWEGPKTRSEAGSVMHFQPRIN
jgi:hypothetical protein